MSSSYTTGSVHGSRGGSWYVASRFGLLTDRVVSDPSRRNSAFGVRLARRAP